MERGGGRSERRHPGTGEGPTKKEPLVPFHAVGSTKATGTGRQKRSRGGNNVGEVVIKLCLGLRPKVSGGRPYGKRATLLPGGRLGNSSSGQKKGGCRKLFIQNQHKRWQRPSRTLRRACGQCGSPWGLIGGGTGLPRDLSVEERWSLQRKGWGGS